MKLLSNLFKPQYLILTSVLFASAASAQFVAVSGGGLLPQDLSASAPAGIIGGITRAGFSNASIVAVDGGVGFLPFIGIGVHYSHSTPELDLRRGDAFGSRALVDLESHTVTFDARLNTPRFFGFRAYGFGGVGLSRFSVDVKSQVEVPFPRGVPETLTAPVGTFGGGIEKRVLPFISTKFEVRDYLTPIPSSIYAPAGLWHRVAVLGGVVLGR
ncbi:MAG: hypothetical protein HYX72_07155 [Acidobacteria bacterium]|nr:hypothetical protein [Acidobacteriota bacterium]